MHKNNDFHKSINFHKLAHSIVQEYIERHGASFVDIDNLDQMIEDALNKVDSDSWQEGYDAAREDYEMG